MAKTNCVSKKQLSQKNAPRGLWVGALIALVVLAGLGLTASRQPEAPAAASAPPLPLEVSVSEAAALRDSGAFILDVREPYEWEAGHIPGAALIPLGELTGRAAEVPRTGRSGWSAAPVTAAPWGVISSWKPGLSRLPAWEAG